MRFAFPVLLSVMIAMLFVSFYARWPSPLSFSTSETDRPKPSRPNPLQVLSAPPAPSPDVAPEPKLDAVAATPAPAPDATAEPALDAVAATPAPAPDLTPEPKLDAVVATPAPAPDATPEPKLDAAPKAQSAPDVLRKVEPAAGPARAEAPPKKKRVTATGPTGAAGATTGTELARPRDRDFGQAAGELPPDQSALKAEVTGESAMNQPMQPIPPASDTLPATNAAPISVPQSATPAPNRPAVQLDSDEMNSIDQARQGFPRTGQFRLGATAV